MTHARNLTVQLVLHPSNRGWILEKFADRLVQHLGHWGVDAAISDTTSPSADLHHFMMYLHGPPKRIGPASALITHVDRPQKMFELSGLLERLDVAVCVSRMSVDRLVSFGLPSRKLCAVVPGCDPAPAPRRTVIVIATRLYRDMRKREHLLVRLAHSMSLHNFRFEILGQGWEQVANELGAAGAEVRHSPPSGDYVADHTVILDRLRTADYYLYLGLDEGSMGLMDALAAGIGTIATAQGFHLDLPGGLTHPFLEFPELLTIFQQLARERQDRIDAVGRFSWEEYARRHAMIWRAVLDGGTVDFSTLLDPDTVPQAASRRPSGGAVASRWGQMVAEEGARLGRYLWHRVRGRTQPSDSRPRRR